MPERNQITAAVVAVFLLVGASTLVLGGSMADAGPSAVGAQETTATETVEANQTATVEGTETIANETTAFETTDGAANETTVANATTGPNATDGAATQRFFFQNLTLNNVVAENVTIERLMLPNGNTLHNVTIPRVMLSGSLQAVTLNNVTINDESLAQQIEPAGPDASFFRLQDETISGVYIENATVFNSNFVTVERVPASETNATLTETTNATVTETANTTETTNATEAPPAVEVGTAFIEFAQVRELRIVTPASQVGNQTTVANETTAFETTAFETTETGNQTTMFETTVFETTAADNETEVGNETEVVVTTTTA